MTYFYIREMLIEIARGEGLAFGVLGMAGRSWSSRLTHQGLELLLQRCFAEGAHHLLLDGAVLENEERGN